MIIHFYLDNGNPITSFHKLISNPFNIGDEILISVEDILPRDLTLGDASAKTLQFVKSQNADLKESFHNGTIKLQKEVKHMRFNELMEPELTIEYYCTKIN